MEITLRFSVPRRLVVRRRSFPRSFLRGRSFPRSFLRGLRFGFGPTRSSIVRHGRSRKGRQEAKEEYVDVKDETRDCSRMMIFLNE